MIKLLQYSNSCNSLFFVVNILQEFGNDFISQVNYLEKFRTKTKYFTSLKTITICLF